MAMVPQKVWTADELAAYLQLDPATIRDWCREQKIKSFKAGREYRILQEDVDAYIRQNPGGVKKEGN